MNVFQSKKKCDFVMPRSRWPIEFGKKQGLYFYLEPIEELFNGHVKVKGIGEMIMLSSYSYLGLLGHSRIKEKAQSAIDKFGTGTHGVRLLAGTLSLHNELEEKIAHFYETESAIVFSSGYVANLATISTLVRRGDQVFCDKLNHASIMEGCFLSGARLVRFRHNDMDHLEDCLKKADVTKNKLVVVDAAFSMDGDIVKLPELSRICRKHGALLMVDEAHSLGVIGKTGHGIEEYFHLGPDTIDIKMGTLSKAIPSMGGYIASSLEIIELLKHNSSGFVYSASLAPPLVAAAIASFDVIEEEPERVSRLHTNMTYFRESLKKRGFNTLNSETAIVPIICGSREKAMLMARICRDRQLFIQGIPSPVVPSGTERLRAIVTAAHNTEDINYSIDTIEEAGRELCLI
jgi:8-amino-7-oxononanoate synthase